MAVELWRAIAGTDGDGFVHPFAQWFEDFSAEVLEVGDYLNSGW